MNTSADYKNPLIFEIIAWGPLAGLIILPFFYYDQLPDQIPSHFNGKGEPDAFSKKSSIWMLPIIGTAIFLFLHYLARIKDLRVNYPKKLSPEQEHRKIGLARQLLHTLKIILPAIFLFIVYRTIQTALGHSQGLGRYFIYIFLLLIFGVIAYYLIQMGKKE